MPGGPGRPTVDAVDATLTEPAPASPGTRRDRFHGELGALRVQQLIWCAPA